MYIRGLNIVIGFGGLNAGGQCFILDLNRSDALRTLNWKAVKYGRMPVDMYGFGWVTIADRYIVTFGGIDAMSPAMAVPILICDTHALYRSHCESRPIPNIWTQSDLV